jgi:hypothetical protein
MRTRQHFLWMLLDSGWHMSAPSQEGVNFPSAISRGKCSFRVSTWSCPPLGLHCTEEELRERSCQQLASPVVTQPRAPLKMVLGWDPGKQSGRPPPHLQNGLEHLLCKHEALSSKPKKKKTSVHLD